MIKNNIENIDSDFNADKELKKLQDEILKNKENKEKKEKFSIKSYLDNLKKSVLENIETTKVENKEQFKENVETIFKRGLEELTDKEDTLKETEFVNKMKNINFDNPEVKKEKQKSFDGVLSSIADWKKQKDPVAKVLLRMSNRIMSTEK